MEYVGYNPTNIKIRNLLFLINLEKYENQP